MNEIISRYRSTCEARGEEIEEDEPIKQQDGLGGLKEIANRGSS